MNYHAMRFRVRKSHSKDDGEARHSPRQTLTLQGGGEEHLRVRSTSSGGELDQSNPAA
jgi:hypothetical protein